MSSDAAPRTYARAVSEYDEAHERALVDAIARAIFDASMVADVNCAVIRTGELASALLTVLAGALAMSPSATRSPSAVRRTVDELGKRLRQRIAAAERDPNMQDFVRRAFRGTDAGGRA